MSFIVTVLFPNDPAARYDIEYSTDKQMPRTFEQRGKFGVIGWNVKIIAPGPDGAEPLFAFRSDVFWKTKEHLVEAFQSTEAAEIFEDVQNFSNMTPVFLYRDVMKEG